jgi:hypothetical protein
MRLDGAEPGNPDPEGFTRSFRFSSMLAVEEITVNKGLVFLMSIPILGLALVLPAHALTYMPMSDASLLGEADLVVLGRIASAGPVPGQERQATRYVLQAQQVLKGSLTAEAFTVRVPGAFDPGLDDAVVVPGAPRFTVGEQALLFLNRREDGSYAVTEFALGAFPARTTISGTAVLVRDLSEDAALGDGQPRVLEPSRRDLNKFAEWLRSGASDRSTAAGYWNAEPLAEGPLQPRFTTEGNPPGRWFEFAEGRSVAFYAGTTGQAGVPGGGYLEFQEAILAWNTNLGSTINYVFSGTSNASGGLSTADGVNEILFNDPNNDIGGTFDCARGGTLGVGMFRGSGTGSFNGGTFQRIKEADIVIRKGAGCAMSGHLNANAAELFGHELGHTLGLGHPCGDPGQAACVPGTAQDEALMRPLLHGDGRGASLRQDDQRGASYLYAVGARDPTAQTTQGSGGASQGGGGAWHPAALGVLLLLARRRHSPRVPASGMRSTM